MPRNSTLLGMSKSELLKGVCCSLVSFTSDCDGVAVIEEAVLLFPRSACNRVTKFSWPLLEKCLLQNLRPQPKTVSLLEKCLLQNLRPQPKTVLLLANCLVRHLRQQRSRPQTVFLRCLWLCLFL